GLVGEGVNGSAWLQHEWNSSVLCRISLWPPRGHERLTPTLTGNTDVTSSLWSSSVTASRHVLPHTCHSQRLATCSAPDRDTPQWRSADVPPVRRGAVPCPRVGGLLEVPGNEGIFPPPTLRPR